MYRKYWKRILDIVCAILLLPFFLLILLVVAPAILIDDSGPVFYNAERLGRNGKIFRMYKFRSMKVNAPDLRNADGTTFNSKEDSRVTRVGRILRKTSLDEVPQILNILKGDMSFVGPRPDLPDSIVWYTGDRKKKLQVFPGITGYSQAYYRNSSTLEQRFSGDLYYTENLSFLLDIRIIGKTLETVLKKDNIYRNAGEWDEK